MKRFLTGCQSPLDYQLGNEKKNSNQHNRMNYYDNNWVSVARSCSIFVIDEMITMVFVQFGKKNRNKF